MRPDPAAAAAVDRCHRAADDVQQDGGRPAAAEGDSAMLPAALQLAADAMTDRGLALAAVVSMSGAEAEYEPDVTVALTRAEKISDWITGAETDAERQLRRTAAVLAARTTSKPGDLYVIAKHVARWLRDG